MIIYFGCKDTHFLFIPEFILRKMYGIPKFDFDNTYKIPKFFLSILYGIPKFDSVGDTLCLVSGLSPLRGCILSYQ